MSVDELYGGFLIISPESESKMFVKKIFVTKYQDASSLSFGYDCYMMDLDRDRSFFHFSKQISKNSILFF